MLLQLQRRVKTWHLFCRCFCDSSLPVVQRYEVGMRKTWQNGHQITDDMCRTLLEDCSRDLEISRCELWVGFQPVRFAICAGWLEVLTERGC